MSITESMWPVAEMKHSGTEQMLLQNYWDFIQTLLSESGLLPRGLVLTWNLPWCLIIVESRKLIQRKINSKKQMQKLEN